MSCHTKVINTSKNSQLKRSQAARWVAEGLAVWIEEDYSIRECSFTEKMAIRAKQQALEASLAPIELSDCIWEPPERDKFTQSERYALVGAAYQFHRESIFPAQ